MTIDRTPWTRERAHDIYSLPFSELLFQAQAVHRTHFNNSQLELCTLLSIKTGACPEDCAYCTQSAYYQTDLKKEKLMSLNDILEKAKIAKEKGTRRFCMGAAWRNLPTKSMPAITEIIKEVKALGLETCMTLGMLTEEQARELKHAGLDYYNHNLDTSPEYYDKIINTRTYQDRLDTLDYVSNAGISVCCGGILGMGETEDDRLNLLCQLANLKKAPCSIPLNKLIPIPGTPLENATPIEDIDFVRMIATARIMMPASKIRLSAGRDSMSETMHALCFMAGANSIHFGEKLLTRQNRDQEADYTLMDKLGLHPSPQIPDAAPASCSTSCQTHAE